MPPFMRFYKNTKKAKSKSKKKSKNTTASFSSETKNRIASFTRKITRNWY